MIPARFEFYATVLVTCTMLLNYTVGQARSRDASCSQTFSGKESGQLLSPGYPQEYKTSEFCNYAIQLPSNRQVNLTFTEVALEKWNASLVDFIVLFDGVDCMSKRIAAVVNISTPTYISSGNSMVALFTSDVTGQFGPFAANFTAVSGVDPTKPVPPFPENKILIQCGKEIKGDSGSLSYQGKEGRNYLCIWRISVQSGKTIAFNLTKLSISYPGNWLRLLDGSDCGAPVVHFVYGDSGNRLVSLTSTSNTMMVIYAALSGNTTDLFEATYHSVPAPPGTASKAGSGMLSMVATNLLLITAARSYAFS
ncbi:unnamed protein product [Dicrocoelium dendriticum]|nr:unnamed protein product [Dicrocoelium dendriticum]